MVEKLLKGEEDLDELKGELTNSNLQEDSGLYFKDEELETELIWVDEPEQPAPVPV